MLTKKATADATVRSGSAAAARPRIVVGVDGSTGSKKALRWAADYAASTGGALHVVSSWCVPTTLGWAFPPSEEGLPVRHATKVLEATIDEVFGAERPDGLRESVVQGHPAAALLAAADGADLLVVGSRGHGSFASALVGSVGTHCSQHATCPVAIIRD